ADRKARHASDAEFHALGRGAQRAEQRDGFGARLRHHAVAHPYRVERAGALGLLRELQHLGPGRNAEEHAALRQVETEADFCIHPALLTRWLTALYGSASDRVLLRDRLLSLPDRVRLLAYAGTPRRGRLLRAAQRCRADAAQVESAFRPRRGRDA